MGGGYFQFFTKNRPQNHQKGAILQTSQANGGARTPPAPPGYATVRIPLSSLFGQLAFAAAVRIFFLHCKHQHGFSFSQRNQLG